MTYRDEDDAAAARIQRLEAGAREPRLVRGGPRGHCRPSPRGGRASRQAEPLEAERKAQSTGSVRAGPPRRVWLGMGITTACARVTLLLPSSSGWLLLSPLRFSLVRAELVIQGFVFRWREGAAAREAETRE